MNDLLIVDKADEVIGCGEKLSVHRSGQLHRAFSIFLFSLEDRRLLIQRRANGKYHSGGLWSNSCCSHPRKGKEILSELNQRLNEEISYDADVVRISAPGDPPEKSFIFCGKFGYFAQLGELVENEIDSVYVLFMNLNDQKKISVNPEEASACQWIKLDDLVLWLRQNPEDFTAWFVPALKLAVNAICGEIERKGDADCELNSLVAHLNSLETKPGTRVFSADSPFTGTRPLGIRCMVGGKSLSLL